jgi:hypothetical protein
MTWRVLWIWSYELGRLHAHDDAVSAICLPASDPTKLLTASWDGKVKLWDIGREIDGGGGARAVGAFRSTLGAGAVGGFVAPASAAAAHPSLPLADMSDFEG